jgi:predicted enzyme related to lactoylglutathione lyase
VSAAYGVRASWTSRSPTWNVAEVQPPSIRATASGGRPMPDGSSQGPGGWNRIVLYVNDLSASISTLEKARVHFRNAIESGPGGKQVLLDDPDGNPIELHEAPAA